MTNILALIAADPNVDPALRSVLLKQSTSVPARRAAYVSALLKFDWTFEFSDDHRVWRAGRDELKRLRAERAAVDPDGVLWKLHAHQNYRHG